MSTGDQPAAEVINVRELRFLEHEVYQFDAALEAGIAALPETSVERAILQDVLLLLRTAESKPRLYPAGFSDWVAAQVESGAVDELRAAVTPQPQPASEGKSL